MKRSFFLTSYFCSLLFFASAHAMKNIPNIEYTILLEHDYSTYTYKNKICVVVKIVDNNNDQKSYKAYHRVMGETGDTYYSLTKPQELYSKMAAMYGKEN